MKKIIVTGANGVGKSHFAARLAAARSDLPLLSYDAIRLEDGWTKRPQTDIEAELSNVLKKDAWIIEGGPSLLPYALASAEGVVWLDPPEILRTWRLAIRPWRNIGKTRPELPMGNVDWPLEQYRFALRSLNNRSKLRESIESRLTEQKDVYVWHCRLQREVEKAIGELAGSVG